MSERLLVVDDNPLNLKLMEFLLTKQGYEVRTALDASAASAVLETFSPKMILVDLQMPGEDGFALTHRLKTDPKTHDIIIVAVTAYAMRGDEERARAAGCDGYIVKPINTRTLPEIVASYLSVSSQETP